MADTLPLQLAVEQTSQDEFMSTECPLENRANIAYGGCALGNAILAAWYTTPASFHLYSVLGQYLGPSTRTEKLKCRVYRIRDTRTFVTRRVVVTQQRQGKDRACLQLTADFHVKEPAHLVYSTPPTRQYPRPTEVPDAEDAMARMLSEGKITKDQVQSNNHMMRHLNRYIETRHCPESVSGQNLSGLAKNSLTTQDHLPIHDKVSAEWQRIRHKLGNLGEQYAATAFMMDGGIAFLPLVHSHKFTEDVEAVSSLDFALRLFTTDTDMNEWTLRERKTIAADAGLHYTESRLWDQQGRLAAVMTQQGIIRPKIKSEAKI